MQFLKGVRSIPVEQWVKLLESDIKSTPFQSIEYVNILNSTPGFSAEVYGLTINDELKAVCVVALQQESGLKSFFSKRAIIYGGPVVSNQSLKFFSNLLHFIEKDLKGRSIYLEVRNFSNYSHYRELYKKAGWEYIPYLNVQINLKDVEIETLLSDMKSNRRREIRYSEENGAFFKQVNNEKDLKELFDILYNLYSNVVKLPLPDYKYFLNLYKSSVGKVIGVFHQERLIGGAVCLFYPGKSIYTQYYCGLRNYDKKIYPTHLAIKGAMEFGIENGLESIDLMGAGKPDEKYGVRDYKKQFGGEVVEHGRYRKILNPVLFKTGEKGLEFMQKFNIEL